MKFVIQYLFISILVSFCGLFAQGFEINDRITILGQKAQKICSITYHLEDVVSLSIAELYSDGTLKIVNSSERDDVFILVDKYKKEYLVVPFGNDSSPGYIFDLTDIIHTKGFHVNLEVASGKIEILCDK